MISEDLEPELVRVLKLTVFKKKFENVPQIINKQDDFIYYFGEHFKLEQYSDGDEIMSSYEVPTKSMTLVNFLSVLPN